MPFEQHRADIRVHFIEAQRLMRVETLDRRRFTGVERPPVEASARECARHLGDRLRNELSVYASSSQRLDQTYPVRLMTEHLEPLSDLELARRLEDIEEKRTELATLGILGDDAAAPQAAPLQKLDDSQRRALTLYVNDTAQKLAVLDTVATRTRLLVEGLNGRLRNKRLRIDRQKGFVVELSDGRVIDPGSLSSGEQHELILHYDLLFRTEPETLVLIDEPELSLHVAWQKTFLDDLLRITDAVKCDVVLATHSPFIVGARSDLLVALDGGENGGR